MRKKTVVTVISILLAVIFLAVALCLIPWPCPISHTLTATKLDAQGNSIGTVEISMRGFKTHSLIFGEKWYNLKIGAFEGYFATELQMSRFNSPSLEDYKSLTGVVNNVTYEGDLEQAIRDDALIHTSYMYTICHSPDYDMWLLKMDDTCYIGSLSGDHAILEIAEYYQDYLPKK